MTCWRLYLYETILQRLTQHFQHMASEFRQFIQKEHAAMSQADFAGAGPVDVAAVVVVVMKAFVLMLSPPSSL